MCLKENVIGKYLELLMPTFSNIPPVNSPVETDGLNTF